MPTRGWVLFDGNCRFCLGWARRLQPLLRPRGFDFLPLQTPWVRAHFNLPEEELLGEMRVLMRNSETFGGADAAIHLARYIWWALPLVAVARIPGMRVLLRAAYRSLAARRQCLSGACALKQPPAVILNTRDEGGIER